MLVWKITSSSAFLGSLKNNALSFALKSKSPFDALNVVVNFINLSTISLAENFVPVYQLAFFSTKASLGSSPVSFPSLSAHSHGLKVSLA